MPPARTTAALVFGTGSVVALFWALRATPAQPTAPVVAPPVASQLVEPATLGCAVPPRSLPPPSDLPPRLSCSQAKSIAAQARANLTSDPPNVDAAAFAQDVRDWLDPHGLWSAAPDSPLTQPLNERATALLASMQSDEVAGCAAAIELGGVLEQWVTTLREAYQEARSQAPAGANASALWQAASESPFESSRVERPALDLSRALGERLGLLAQAGTWSEPLQQRASARLFPRLDGQGWADALLAAALRSYVLHIDAHGAWAPADEETSLYEVELEGSGRTRLWDKMSRTAVGLRIDERPLGALQQGDIVLSIGGVATAGLSVEQAEQLGVLDPDDSPSDKDVEVLRGGSLRPIRVRVSVPEVTSEQATEYLASSMIDYGSGVALLIRVPDVPDTLGIDVAEVLSRTRRTAQPVGVVLDLRGNGGGSIDGAKDAVGLFLPGAPLFPMRRRSGPVEVEVAPYPPNSELWTGPVAVIVDGGTASAAEMIAGALAAYDRAVLIGSRTYGKGCAQEYIDDVAGMGVLRLTTLLYALPDGSPVQRVGLMPHIQLKEGPLMEREDTLAHALQPWRGPDVRPPRRSQSATWPLHGGRVGPCAKEGRDVCAAMRMLGPVRPATASRGSRVVVEPTSSTLPGML